jgi:acyl-CoA thioester hydrolase
MTDFEGSLPLKLRIDWSELDYFGHVNNVSYYKYIQSARVFYMEHIGLTQSYQDRGIGPILASCTCDFKQPLFYPGNVTIFARADMIKHTSFRICYRLIDDQGNIAAEAQDIMVMFDFKQNKKIAISDQLRETIETFEKAPLKD